MKKLLSKEEAKKLLPRTKNLLPVSLVKNGFIATDFQKTYLLSKEDGYQENEIWAHNQPWVVFEIDEPINFPIWFSKDIYDKALQNKENKVVVDGDGFCYSPGHNQYTGAGWYASSAEQAIIGCISDWTPIWDVTLTPMKLLYDNGKVGYVEKAMQVWRHNTTYSLTFFHSREEKAVNVEGFSKEAIELVKYATDARDSKWRLGKRWAQLLKFEGEISEFENLSEKYIAGLTGHVAESVSVATAGEYFLVKFEWGGLFGGEGDAGEDFYFFENESEFLEKLNELASK